MALVQQQTCSDPLDGFEVLGLDLGQTSATLGALGHWDGGSLVKKLLSTGSPSNPTISILLERPTNSSNDVTGTLTLDAVITGQEDIKTMPRLALKGNTGDEPWIVLLDEGGIAGSDGASLNGTQDTQLRVAFNAALTISQVPK